MKQLGCISLKGFHKSHYTKPFPGEGRHCIRCGVIVEDSQ